MILKRILTAFIFLLMFFCLRAQCPIGNATATPAFDASTLTLGTRTTVSVTTWVNEYITINNLTPGNTYTFDGCGASTNTEVNIFNGSTSVAFDQNSCASGDDGEVSYTVPAGVTSLRFQINLDGNCVNQAPNLSQYITLTTILPVELIDFIAKVKNNLVQLFWETGSELNNGGFEVERSTDGVTWKKLDFIVGKGTTNEIQRYTYEDINPLLGINYYRLKQMDLDGEIEYSNIVSANFLGEIKKSPRIVPNPIIGRQFRLIPPNIKAREGSFTLFNLSGNIVFKTNIISENELQLQIDDLPSGIYLAETELDGQTWIEKIVFY